MSNSRDDTATKAGGGREEAGNIAGTSPDPLAKLAPAEGAGVGKVIAVMSGKGGVGKSSVAALLAVSLRRAGNRVGVLDADITGPSIPRLFGITERPAIGPNGLILPVETKTGIEVISINLMLSNEDQPVIWRGPLISGAVKQFFTQVYWGNLDYLVVDLPPGTGDAPLTVLQSLPLDGIILVASPQQLAHMIVRKAQHMAQSMSVPVIGMVENLSILRCPHCGEEIAPFGKGRAEELAKEAGLTLLAKLPIDPAVAEAGDAGTIEDYQGEWVSGMARWVMNHERSESH